MILNSLVTNVPRLFLPARPPARPPDRLPARPRPAFLIPTFGHSCISGFGVSHIITVFWPYHMDFISTLLVIGPSPYIESSSYIFPSLYVHIPCRKSLQSQGFPFGFAPRPLRRCQRAGCGGPPYLHVVCSHTEPSCIPSKRACIRLYCFCCSF